VYGGSLDNVKGCTNKVENGDKVSLGADVNILALHTPWYGFFFKIFGFLLNYYSES
jgi:hydroxyacylglutathione hydrolase